MPCSGFTLFSSIIIVRCPSCLGQRTFLRQVKIHSVKSWWLQKSHRVQKKRSATQTYKNNTSTEKLLQVHCLFHSYLKDPWCFFACGPLKAVAVPSGIVCRKKSSPPNIVRSYSQHKPTFSAIHLVLLHHSDVTSLSLSLFAFSIVFYLAKRLPQYVP